MTAVTITPAVEARIARAVLDGDGLGLLARELRLPALAVEDLAKRWVDTPRHHLEHAVEVLEARAASGKPSAAPKPAPRAAASAAPVRPVGPPTSGGERLRAVPVSRIKPDPENPRGADLPEIDELAASIAEVGLLQPLVVRPASGHWIVVAGHRRLAAVKSLGWGAVECITREAMSRDQVLAAMLIENSQRVDLDPIAQARGVGHLRRQLATGDQTEATMETVARRLGRSQMWVSKRVSLLALSPEEQEQVRRGEMSIDAGAQTGRIASGRVRRRDSTGHPHLGAGHELGKLAQARCTRLKHKRGGRNSVGGIACGECWESVIRADERSSLQIRSLDQGACVLCKGPVDAHGRPA